jgi:hypothetical protein
MPRNLFMPIVKEIARPSFNETRTIAEQFGTSLLATALRLVAVNFVPLILTCYNGERLRWFQYSKDVPTRWYLHRALNEDTFAYDLLTKNKVEAAPRKSSADSWFTNDDAENYEVYEHSALGRNGEVLTLIFPENAMLDAGFDRGLFPERYDASGKRTYKPARK